MLLGSVGLDCLAHWMSVLFRHLNPDGEAQSTPPELLVACPTGACFLLLSTDTLIADLLPISPLDLLNPELHFGGPTVPKTQ